MAGQIKRFNLAKVTTATTGTGTVTLGGAVTSFLTFALAGVVNGDWVRYAIVDGNAREVGYGQYTASGTTLTRNPVTSTNSNAAITLSGGAQVFITVAAEDFTMSLNRNISRNAPLASQFTDTSVFGRSSSATALTLTDDSVNGLGLVDGTSDAAGFKSNVRAVPGAPTTFEFAARLRCRGIAQNTNYALIFADATGKAMFWGVLNQAAGVSGYATPSWNLTTWDDGTFGAPINQADWFKIGFDGSGNVLYYAGMDGVNWTQIYTVTLASRGVGTITRYGFMLGRFGSGGTRPMQVPWFYSDEFPAPVEAAI